MFNTRDEIPQEVGGTLGGTSAPQSRELKGIRPELGHSRFLLFSREHKMTIYKP